MDHSKDPDIWTTQPNDVRIGVIVTTIWCALAPWVIGALI